MNLFALFSRGSKVKKRTREQEEADAESRVYRQQFTCDNCGIGYAEVYILKGMRKEEVGPFPCGRCGCLFEFKAAPNASSSGESIIIRPYRRIELEE